MLYDDGPWAAGTTCAKQFFGIGGKDATTIGGAFLSVFRKAFGAFLFHFVLLWGLNAKLARYRRQHV